MVLDTGHIRCAQLQHARHLICEIYLTSKVLITLIDLIKHTQRGKKEQALDFLSASMAAPTPLQGIALLIMISNKMALYLADLVSY